jgi:hypothetical protein
LRCTLFSAVLLLCCTCAAHSADTYNSANGQLTIPALMIGSASYSNVVVKVGSVLSDQQGAPNGSVDTYNPMNKQLAIPAVNVGDTTYTNVLITVGSLVSIGAANWIDTYNAASGQLRISSIQVGSTTYNNVVVTVGSILSAAGGMPNNTADQYTPANKELVISAVQLNSHVYTNVAITVGRVVSLGAASRFNDAPVQGLCYSTYPSATASASTTNLNGLFLYDAGDVVTFWVDGSGSGCAGTTTSTSTSVMLGYLAPTGSQTSVLAFAGGLEAAATLTALNVGSATLMNVSGLLLRSSDAANLSKFIKNEGGALPGSSNGSIDTFFNGVQADTLTASDSAVPAFVTPVAPNASTTTTVLGNTVAGNLLTTVGSLPDQPTSITVPAAGQLKFSVAASRYTCPICAAPATVYTSDSASFLYLDGQGHVTQINNPGTDVITTSNLADQTQSGTYTINENVLSKSMTGTSALNGYTYLFSYSLTEHYFDGTTSLGSSPSAFSIRYTSGPYNGGVFSTGYTVVDSIDLTPVTLSMLAGKTVTTPANGCPNNENVLTFVGTGAGPSSVTFSQSCGGLSVTLVPSVIPGLLEGTDTSGYIIYVGVFGSGLVVGAQFVLIQESAGSLGSNGNGNPYQWEFSGPILGVN